MDGHRRRIPCQIPPRPSGTPLGRLRWYTRWSSTYRTRWEWQVHGFPCLSAAARHFHYPLAHRDSWEMLDCTEARLKTSLIQLLRNEGSKERALHTQSATRTHTRERRRNTWVELYVGRLRWMIGFLDLRMTIVRRKMNSTKLRCEILHSSKGSWNRDQEWWPEEKQDAGIKTSWFERMATDTGVIGRLMQGKKS